MLCYCCYVFSRDDQTRKIQENINNVEKHFGEMCQMFAGYVRKTARLRDKADMLVKEIGVYADLETPNLKRGMKEFADHLAKVEDYRQAEVKGYLFQTLEVGEFKHITTDLAFALQVERLEARVIEPLKSYGAIVKRKRVSGRRSYTYDGCKVKDITSPDCFKA